MTTDNIINQDEIDRDINHRAEKLDLMKVSRKDEYSYNMIRMGMTLLGRRRLNWLMTFNEDNELLKPYLKQEKYIHSFFEAHGIPFTSRVLTYKVGPNNRSILDALDDGYDSEIDFILTTLLGTEITP